jgi:hypothetical protein
MYWHCSGCMDLASTDMDPVYLIRQQHSWAMRGIFKQMRALCAMRGFLGKCGGMRLCEICTAPRSKLWLYLAWFSVLLVPDGAVPRGLRVAAGQGA